VPPLLDQPPSDLPAPVVGTLVDGRPQTRDAVAALVDMAQRGLLRLAPTTSAGMLLIPLVGRTDDVRLRDYEHALLRALYGTSEISQPLDLAAARGRFARGLLAVRRALMDTLVGAGLFEHAPLLRLGSFRWLGAVLAFVGFIVGVQGQPAPLLGVAPAARLVGLALIVAGLLLHFGGRAGARRTLTGALEAKRWQAFERFLTKSADTAAWRDEYLPYAIAFGLDRAWLQRLEAAQRPMPGWYDATYSPSTPTYVGVTPADSTGSTAYVAGGAPPSFSLPSPQAWSDSLANLLDSASTTLASAGSSSSGGSGSSSDFGSSSGDGGGGFSGGGDSGGDGGGGGSGSFS
jgi:uncharacterized membrane protein YgcG